VTQHGALFVLSTGRCGTQWLADALACRLGDDAVVTHEPLDNDYAPREMLGAGDPKDLDDELAEPLLDHIDFIEEVLQTRPYIECGHPSWSSIPYLMRRFEGRVSVVHLVRHPVQTAFSWLTHLAYCPPLAPHLREKVLLSPFDEGVRFPSYRNRWSALTPYEKALYYWLEVNALGLEIASLRVRYEDLFDPRTLDHILTFAGLAASAGSAATDPQQVVDRFHHVSPNWFNPYLIERHPEVIDLATRMSYEPLVFDEVALKRRYRVI
jgi:hypothetical protein